MKKILPLILYSLLIGISTFGQDRTAYKELIDSAYTQMEKNQFESASLLFFDAFEMNIVRGTHINRWRAAEAFAQTGRTDSAFVQLFLLADFFIWQGSSYFVSDSLLNPLKKDERWIDFVNRTEENLKAIQKNYDHELIKILDVVYYDDQHYRQQLDSLEGIYGRKSKEVQDHWHLIKEKDSLNLIIVQRILDEHGWLGADIIGYQGNSTLFLVIQHSDIETQEKYLPMMRLAVEKGNAQGSSLALLEDRVLLRRGKKQIYGSQIGIDSETGEHFVQALEDPDNVDERRKKVGLGPLADYVTNWGMTWDVEEYKRKLPKFEAKLKQQ